LFSHLGGITMSWGIYIFIISPGGNFKQIAHRKGKSPKEF